MEITIEIRGEVVERGELLNGTETVTIEGASGDGWRLSGIVSWSLGLIEYAGEGDITLAADDGAEIFGTVTAVVAQPEDSAEGGEQLRIRYEIDGGSGRLDEAGGTIEAVARVAGADVAGTWRVSLTP